MEYRSVTLRDFHAFIEMRMEFVQSIRKLDDEAQFRQDTEAYFAAHIGQDDFSAFVAEENGRISACCMACFYQTAPRPRCPSGRYAELLNVYTRPDCRRQGHAETLVRLQLAEAKRRGADKVLLDYTEAGLPLYRKLGFLPVEHSMERTL